MKNITIQTIFFLVLFTIIGCEQYPISPIVETGYSVTNNPKTGTGFISNAKKIPLDTVIKYLTLNDSIGYQESRIKKLHIPFFNQSGGIHWYYPYQLKLLTEKYSKLIGAQNKNDKKIMNELNKQFISEQDSLIKEYNTLLQEDIEHLQRCIRRDLNDSQIIIWDKWVSSGRISYRWNPMIRKTNNFIGG